MPKLTERQQREVEYHRDYASRREHRPVDFAVVDSDRRRWWNAYWHTWTLLRGLDLQGKRALVVGCGFGEDAIRLTRLGCEVWACDLSPESIAVARQSGSPVHWSVQPAESLTYENGHFDLVLCIDILHHVEITACMDELRRVSAPGAWFVADEIYTHSWLERVRRSSLVDGWLYPRLLRWVYGTDRPYITQDERKLSEKDLELLNLQGQREYFNLIVGRLVSDRWEWVCKVDRLALWALGGLGRWFCARVVVCARL